METNWSGLVNCFEQQSAKTVDETSFDNQILVLVRERSLVTCKSYGFTIDVIGENNVRLLQYPK